MRQYFYHILTLGLMLNWNQKAFQLRVLSWLSPNWSPIKSCGWLAHLWMRLHHPIPFYHACARTHARTHTRTHITLSPARSIKSPCDEIVVAWKTSSFEVRRGKLMDAKEFPDARRKRQTWRMSWLALFSGILNFKLVAKNNLLQRYRFCCYCGERESYS